MDFLRDYSIPSVPSLRTEATRRRKRKRRVGFDDTGGAGVVSRGGDGAAIGEGPLCVSGSGSSATTGEGPLCMSGSGSGGNGPRIIKSATDQLNKLSLYHSFWNRTTKPSLDLEKEILKFFTTRQMEKVFFANSASEANDSQICSISRISTAEQSLLLQANSHTTQGLKCRLVPAL
uniref:Uncharacterized protein n=1 Tax=Ananas comosus var. bracteatus TaxID=296719 RepID=A0A6V7P1Y0_ANACO|nr:unnamed protein product [Ananas comosus var. bracteatus]